MKTSNIQSSDRFLTGVKILDLSQYIPGPFATRQLADLGAEVIKVEPPGGDPMRRFMHNKDSVSPVYSHLNRGKRICRIDLKSDQGRQCLRNLITSADVLLESFRPGVLQKLGFDRHLLNEINPRLIHCALSGYGQTGPYMDRAGHDINYCAASGSLQVSGTASAPVIGYPPIVDHAGAMQASIAILGALFARESSGTGTFLDISLFETMLSWQYLPLLTRQSDRADSIINGGAACYNIYQCKDGEFISLGAIEPHFWQRFCKAVDRPKWIERQLETMPQSDLIGELNHLFALESVEHWNQILSSVDCCYEPVIFPHCPDSHIQIKARGSLNENGPAYPGMIDDKQVVTAAPDPFEFDANDTPQWRGK